MKLKYFWLKDQEWHEMYELDQGRNEWMKIKLLFELQELAYHFVFEASNWCVSKWAKEIMNERDYCL